MMKMILVMSLCHLLKKVCDLLSYKPRAAFKGGGVGNSPPR